MGDLNVHSKFGKKERITFVKHLLSDIEALDRMLQSGRLESGITRIGAEQECVLVDSNWRPASSAKKILEEINDPHFTFEIGKFNLEINLDPEELKGSVFTALESQLSNLLLKAHKIAKRHHNAIVLTGILPSFTPRDLTLDNMTETPRYFFLNERLKKLKRTDFLIHLVGVDELTLHHDSVMFEACNTSFQMHLQIDPQDFESSYNWAQAISGPVLGMCVNSPFLFGRELWSETRIALFQQSVDFRPISQGLRNQQARVAFGDSWVEGSIVEYFKNEISSHKMLMSKNIEQTALEVLEAGEFPKLHALNLHNGTIYRWNRPCYGLGNHSAHLRIENRYLPSGPTIQDEMANFAFWVGLMKGRPAKYNNLPKIMIFEEVKSNFIKAARTGSESMMSWFGTLIPLPKLVKEVLLPIAREGLQKMQINTEDIDRLLGIIEARANGKTAAQWAVENFRGLKKTMKPDVAVLYLTKSMYLNQMQNIPVHLWKTMDVDHLDLNLATEVGHIMSTRVYTVHPNDSAALILNLMRWKNIHHIAVVDENEHIHGLLSWSHMQSFIAKKNKPKSNLSVGDVMLREVLTVRPNTSIKEAKSILKKEKIGCLPVVQNKQLVGMLTKNDLYPKEYDQTV